MEENKSSGIVLNEEPAVRIMHPPKPKTNAIPGINYGVDLVTDQIPPVRQATKGPNKSYMPYAQEENEEAQGSSSSMDSQVDGARRSPSGNVNRSPSGNLNRSPNGRLPENSNSNLNSNLNSNRSPNGRLPGNLNSGHRSLSPSQTFPNDDRSPSPSLMSNPNIRINKPARPLFEDQMDDGSLPDGSQPGDDGPEGSFDGMSQGSQGSQFDKYMEEDEEEEMRPVKPKMSYEQIRSRKIETLAALKRLEDQGYEAAGKKCGLTSSLEEIEEVLEKLRAQRDLDNSIKFQRDILVTFVGMIEYACSIEEYNIFDLDMEGWSKAVFENVTDYDEVFEELHFKYKTSMSMPPEMKLLGMLGMSGYRYHLSRQMLSKASGAMPGFNDVINADPELKRRYQDTATRIGQKNGLPPGPRPMSFKPATAPMAEPPRAPQRSRIPMDDPDVDGLLASIKGKKISPRPELNLSEIDDYSN